MVYNYGGRVDNDSNAITKIDEENRSAETKGYINGEYVEFSGGGSSDFSTAQMTVVNNKVNTSTGNIQTNSCPVAYPEDGELGGGFYVDANHKALLM